MTNKKFISLIVISILLAISAAVSININTQNYNFQNRGEVFLKGFYVFSFLARRNLQF